MHLPRSSGGHPLLARLGVDPDRDPHPHLVAAVALAAVAAGLDRIAPS
jgi:hypothetical protein